MNDWYFCEVFMRRLTHGEYGFVLELEENVVISNAKTGGRIGKSHTITLENGKKQKIIEFYYEGGIKEFVSYLNKSKEAILVPSSMLA